MDGIIVINKQKGYTSHDVVAKVNDAFAELVADGTMAALGEKYEVNICK